MAAVLTSEAAENGVRRTPSALAFLLSVLVHGYLLAMVGGELLQTPAVAHAAGVIQLTLQTGGATPAPVEVPEPVAEPVAVMVEPPPPKPVTTPRVTPPRPPTPPRPVRAAPAKPAATSTPRPEPVAQPVVMASASPVAAAPAAPTHALIRITPAYAPEPRYPVIARRMGLEGRVLLRVAVAADGQPQTVEVLTGSGHDILDQAALDAVRGWRFQVQGLTVGMREEVVEVPIRFALK